MADSKRTFQLAVSEHYFRLTTECVRLYSNMTRRHASLGDLLDERAAEIEAMPFRYNAADLKEHLRIIQASGDNRIDLTLDTANIDLIEAARSPLSSALGAPVAFDQALSLLMYDLVVEANSTEVLTKLGLNLEDARRYRAVLDARLEQTVPVH